MAPDIAAPDPASLRRQVEEADARLIATAAALGDGDILGPSLLPGWTRGHVLTHVARNADGLRNLLVWARTGVPTPQYPSAEVRDAQIEAGAGLSASRQLADLRDSAAAFRAEATTLTGAAWQASVRGMRGDEHPAWFTLVRRLTEVEVHHADLDAGYGPADWPEPFVAIALWRAAGDFARGHGVPECRVRLTDGPSRAPDGFDIGTAGVVAAPTRGDDPPDPPHPTAGRAAPPKRAVPAERPTVTGPAHAVLAWLLGRGGGAGLSVEPAGALPRLPPWPLSPAAEPATEPATEPSL